jgi:putative membrane protein
MKEETTNHYARHRTNLANERTLLAYIRTSVTLFAAGATFIRFFGVDMLNLIGGFFILISIVLIIAGFFSFYKFKKHVNGIQR